MSNKFKINDGKGFLIPFPNGYLLSVQFGNGNYGDNYRANIDFWSCDEEGNEDLREINRQAGEHGAHEVEVHVWDSNDEPLEGYPKGPFDNKEVLALICEINDLPVTPKLTDKGDLS